MNNIEKEIIEKLEKGDHVVYVWKNMITQERVYDYSEEDLFMPPIEEIDSWEADMPEMVRLYQLGVE